MEAVNERLQAKYHIAERDEIRYAEYKTDDAELVLVAYGSPARICRTVVDMAREEGLKVGLLRPITLYPFPTPQIAAACGRGTRFLVVEMSCGQMVEDVRLAVNGAADVAFYGRTGGAVPTPVGDPGAGARAIRSAPPLRSLGAKGDSVMEKVFERPKSLTDVEFSYCPGCAHSIVHRMVAEVIDELDIVENCVGICPVGCAVFMYEYMSCDMIEASHGRAPAVATGVKRMLPDTYRVDISGRRRSRVDRHGRDHPRRRSR